MFVFLLKCCCFRNAIIADNHLNQGLKQITTVAMRPLNTMKNSFLNTGTHCHRNKNAAINISSLCLFSVCEWSGSASQYTNIRHICGKMYLLTDRLGDIYIYCKISGKGEQTIWPHTSVVTEMYLNLFYFLLLMVRRDDQH